MVTIKVSEKVATNTTPNEFWVCGNKDYKVKFDFDEVWNAHELKTALFVFGNWSIPVPFTGNICDVPELFDTNICQVGVFAGDLITTTPAIVHCKRSVSDLGGEIPPPTEDVYNRLVQMIESGMLKGDKGEKGDKGDKGDAGVIKFKPVASLPTENIDGSAIYLVPIEGSEEENRFSEYVYIDGKWEVIGAITVNVDHSEYVKFTDKASETNYGVVRTYNSYGVQMYNGEFLATVPATDNDIKTRDSTYKPITPKNLDKAFKASATDNKETWTDEDKAKACETIGAVKSNATKKVLYGNNSAGVQQSIVWAEEPNAYSIARRTNKGGLRVFLDETNDKPEEMATPRGYVDGKYAELLARIEALEGK